MTLLTVTIARIEITRPNMVAETLWVSDTPIRPFAHTDPDIPNQRVLARIVGLPSWGVDVYADPARLTGSVGAGTLVLADADGALSYLSGCQVGRIEIRRGYDGLSWSEWEIMVVAQGEAPDWALSAGQPTRREIGLYDARAALNADVVTDTFGGTNVGATGLDGDPGLEGRVKPLLVGDMSSGYVPAVWANGQRRIALLSAAGIGSGPVGVFDRGGPAALTVAGDYPGTLPDAALSTTQAGTDRAAGLVRLGGATGGDVQFAACGPDAAGVTAPSIAAWLLARRGVTPAEIGASLTGLAAPAVCGMYLGDKTTYRSAIDQLACSWGGWCVPDRCGLWQAGALVEPAAPVLTLNDNHIVRLEVDDAGSARPVESVTVYYAEVAATLTRQGLAEDQWGTPTEALLKERWRRAVATDPRVAGRRDARKVEAKTALRHRVAAEALAARLLAVLGLRADGEPRMSLRVAVEATPARLALLSLGTAVRLLYPPDGIDRPMTLMGYRLWSPAQHLMWLRLFG